MTEDMTQAIRQLEQVGRAVGEEVGLVTIRHHQPHAQRQHQQDNEQDSQDGPTDQPQYAQ